MVAKLSIVTLACSPASPRKAKERVKEGGKAATCHAVTVLASSRRRLGVCCVSTLPTRTGPLHRGVAAHAGVRACLYRADNVFTVHVQGLRARRVQQERKRGVKFDLLGHEINAKVPAVNWSSR